MSILLGNDRKKMATVLVEGMKRDKKSALDSSVSYPDGDAPADDSSTALDASMKSFLSASDRKDTKGMASALKTFVSLCGSTEEPEEDYE